MVEIIRRESDGKYTYKIVRTPEGYLVSSRMKGEAGIQFQPEEALVQTEAMAHSMLRIMMLTAEMIAAYLRGIPSETERANWEAAASEHEELLKRTGEPVVGVGDMFERRMEAKRMSRS